MKKIACVLIIVLVLGLGNSACSSPAPTTSSTPLPTSTTSKTVTTTTTAAVTMPMTKPAAGKSQDLTYVMKPPVNVYNGVIHLDKGETLDLDWKFVANPQVGIEFMVTTPEGREIDAKLHGINLPGHPFYDKNLPNQSPEKIVGSNVIIRVGQDEYCGEGYYSLVFSASPGQTGTIYLKYSLKPLE